MFVFFFSPLLSIPFAPSRIQLLPLPSHTPIGFGYGILSREMILLLVSYAAGWFAR